MLHLLRVGCPWRDMHERYGKWNFANVRFRRWAEQGVWNALLETVAERGLTDDWQHMIDSTTVRGHSQAAGAKGDLSGGFWSITWRLDNKNPRLCRRSGTPLGFVLKGGEAPDYDAVSDLLAIPVGKPRLFLADKGYDDDFLRKELLIHGIRPVIPPQANRKNQPECDFKAYKDRNRIKRMFNRLKQFGRVASRYDETRKSFSAFLALAAAKIWSHTLSTGPSIVRPTASKLSDLLLDVQAPEGDTTDAVTLRPIFRRS